MCYFQTFLTSFSKQKDFRVEDNRGPPQVTVAAGGSWALKGKLWASGGACNPGLSRVVFAAPSWPNLTISGPNTKNGKSLSCFLLPGIFLFPLAFQNVWFQSLICHLHILLLMGLLLYLLFHFLPHCITHTSTSQTYTQRTGRSPRGPRAQCWICSWIRTKARIFSIIPKLPGDPSKKGKETEASRTAKPPGYSHLSYFPLKPFVSRMLSLQWMCTKVFTKAYFF